MKLRNMRLAVFVIVATGAAINIASAQEAASTDRQIPGTIVKAKGAIAIDGRLDESDWKQVKPIAANFVWGKKDVMSQEPRMAVRYLWDDAYLYIGYEVFDSNLVAKASGIVDGPPDNQRPGCEISDTNLPVDVVEFFFVFEDPNFFWEIQHNALNQINDLLCVVSLHSWQKTRIAFVPRDIYWAKEEHIQDEGDRTFASAVSLNPRKDGKPSTVNDADDVDAGYTGELRLPWLGIGAPAVAQTRADGKPGPWKMAGREISILAVCQNGDTPERYFTPCPEMPHEFFHHNADCFPRYIIKEFSPWPW